MVLLESVDGRPHLEQARPVIAAGKPLFIDKPMAGSLADAIEIFRLAEENNVPCFSSFVAAVQRRVSRPCAAKHAIRQGPQLRRAWSPCTLEPHHPDLFWYGIHGVEILFTIMGPGCERVRRVQTDSAELVVGVWKDGRIGTFRGIKSGKSEYGAMIYGAEKGSRPAAITRDTAPSLKRSSSSSRRAGRRCLPMKPSKSSRS